MLKRLVLVGGLTIVFAALGLFWSFNGNTSADEATNVAFDINWNLLDDAKEGDTCSWNDMYKAVPDATVRGLVSVVTVTDDSGQVSQVIPLIGTATATDRGNYCQLRIDASVADSSWAQVILDGQIVATFKHDNGTMVGEERPSITFN